MGETSKAGSRVASRGGTGKLVRGALYVHRDAIDVLPAAERARIVHTVEAAPLARWNVVRIERTAVCLLEYDDFEERAFPRLLSSTKVDAAREEIVVRDFRASLNPLILHRKELMVRPEHPRRAEWISLTEKLERLGLFSDSTRIGRLRHWNGLLAAVNLDPEGRPI